MKQRVYATFETNNYHTDFVKTADLTGRSLFKGSATVEVDDKDDDFVTALIEQIKACYPGIVRFNFIIGPNWREL